MRATFTDHSAVVRRACERMGAQQAANRLRVSRAELESWLAGRTAPPPAVFFRLLDMLKAPPATPRG
jgi:hypothetical protein